MGTGTGSPMDEGMGRAPSYGGQWAGIGAGAIGDIAKGFATGSANDFQAQIARNNAEIARYNAYRETQAGEAATTAIGLKTRFNVGQMKANQAASGIDVNTGSAADVRASAATIGALDAATIRSNAALKAYGYQIEAGTQEAKATMAKRAGRFARLGGIMDASGTLLEGASSVSREKQVWQEQQNRHRQLMRETVGEGTMYPSMTNDNGEAVWAGE